MLQWVKEFPESNEQNRSIYIEEVAGADQDDGRVVAIKTLL